MQNTSYNQISVKPGIRTITILVLFFSTVLFVVQPAKGENGSWVISGEVTDELGNLIPNVEIVAQDSISMDNIASTISDENGYYTMVVPQGTYNLIVTPPPASGFESTTIPNIEVISDTTVNVILVPASTVTFNGYILDRGGEPVPNQRISLSTAGIVVRDTTDEQGFFSMQVSPGLYSLSLEPWGYAPNVPSWYWLYSDDPIQINQDMEMIINLPTRSFTGKVIDQNGAPIPDVRLFIQGGTSFAGFLGSYEYEITTNGNGDFSFIVFSGSASLAVIPPPDSPFGSKVLSELDLTEDVYLTIELTPALSFYGYILDCGGEPVPNQRISLSTASIVVRDTTDEQGFFSMQVSPGSYYLSLEPWGYAPNVPSWYWLYHDSPIQIDQDTEMIINLPTRSFTGKVIDQNGAPIPDVRLFIQGGTSFAGFLGSYEYEITTNGNGDFSFVVFSGSASLAATPPPDSPFGSKVLSELDLTEDVYLTIELTPALSFYGYILDRDGESVPNQQIRLSTASIVVRDATDEQGFFSMQVSPGLYYLSLEPWGYAPNVPSWYWLYSDNPIQIDQDTEMIIDLPTRSFTGKVIDQNGAPIPDVQLFIQGGTSFAGFLGSYEYEITTNGN
ncbi:MAG: carboxypeptidase-like regulatory domain-containing protein, partial [Candidatus Hodarchaeota archaeon]